MQFLRIISILIKFKQKTFLEDKIELMKKIKRAISGFDGPNTAERDLKVLSDHIISTSRIDKELFIAINTNLDEPISLKAVKKYKIFEQPRPLANIRLP